MNLKIKDMNKEQAFNVVNNALNAATQRGAYNLYDAEIIVNAINLLAAELGFERKPQEAPAEAQPE
jgi:20S proteasome alpha/beta subunit